MKKFFLRTVVAVLVIASLGTATVGCTRASEKPAIAYGDYEISRAIFQYLCCLEKTNYLYEAYGVSADSVSSGDLTDNPQIWMAKDAAGVTVADTLKMQVIETVQRYLYFCQQAKDMGYELNESQENMVKDEFASLVARNFDDKKTFNAAMKAYGINYDQMLQYNLIQGLAYQGEDLLFGEKGKMNVTGESAKAYFKDNYITVDCIFINTENKTFPNGKVVVLPDDEKAQKKALADSLYEKLQSGESIVSFYGEYADQPLEENVSSEGYTFEKGGFFNVSAEEKAFEMKEGEVARVDTEGGVYLLSRRALNQDHFEKNSASICALLESAKKTTLLADVQEDFVMDDAFLNSIDVSALQHVI